MNKAILMGRLTKDPEMRYTQDQKAVAKFCLAVPKTKDETTYINCIAYEKTAELVQKYCNKGKQVLVEGSINVRSYDKDGTRQYFTEVALNKIEFCDSAKVDAEPKEDKIPQGFTQIAPDDLPF